jgi:ribosomal protein S18 acetylase RimI-like enzyme
MNIRPIADGDIETLARLAAEDETAVYRKPSRIGPSDIRGWMEWATSTWLYEARGSAVAFSALESHGDLVVFFGVVSQGAKGHGLGTQILRTGERHARSLGAARAQTFVLEPDVAAAELFERHGFRYVRRFWEMAIELDEEPPAPELQAPFTLERFDPADARAFHATMDSAFADHWEHHAIPFEQWWEQKQSAHDFDPSLWFLVRDGDEIAAAIRNDPERNGGGYVGAIGVARPWRGKGLGRALLLRTFAEFWSRGQRRVTLGVDAENPTAATRLYESVGMSAETAAVVYEKQLV